MARSITEKRRRRKEREERRARRRQAAAGRRSVVVRVVVCVAVGIALAVPPAFANDVIGYAPFIAYVLLIAVTGVYLLIVRRMVSFEELGIAGECLRGQDMHFKVRMKNASPLPVLRLEPTFFVSDLFGGDDSVVSASVSLSPFETYEFEFDVNFRHIGTYSAGMRSLRYHDLIGLFSHTFKNDKRHVVEVAPRVFDASGLKFDLELMRERPDAARPLSQDGSDYIGVREYAMGDPMKAVHWKLSARGMEYYTKLFESMGLPGIEAIMDFHSPDYDADDLMSVFDSVVESALSVGAYAQAHGMDFDLVYRDRAGRDTRINARRGARNRVAFTKSLPAVSATEHEGAALALLRRESNSYYSQSNIVLCTSTFDDQTVNALAMVKRKRLNPLLIAVVPPTFGRDELDEAIRPLRRLDALRISYLVVSNAEELGRVR